VVAVRIDRGGAVVAAAVVLIGFGPMAGHPAAGLLLGTLTALSLLLHECGHVAAAQALGVRVREIGLCRRGPYIRREQAREPLDDVIISICGPMVNAVATAVLWTAPGVGHWLAIYNLALVVSNLVPVPGSDGRRIANAWVSRAAAQVPAPIALSKGR